MDLAHAGLDSVVSAHIRRVLAAVRGNKTRAADVLGIPRTSLYHKLRRHGIDAPEEEASAHRR